MASSSKKVNLASDEVIDRFLANVVVWKTIFQMLEVKDRIRLEMTNKRLRILMFECWKTVTSFDTMYELMSSNPDKLSAAFVSICVDRIGDGLRSLTIRDTFYPIDCWTDNLPSIGERCPNVETINFVFEDMRTLDIRFESFSHLKTLTFSSAERDFVYASASVLLSIPASIEVIRGLMGKEEEPFDDAAQIEGFFADRPSLREVSFGDLFTEDGSVADIFRVIAERCPNLTSIELRPYNYDECFDCRAVIALESMKELGLHEVEFDEMEIVTICERSPLVEALELGLRFSSNIDLESAALNALGSLTKLRDFCLETASWVTPSLVTEFVRDLARNSGASLGRLHLPSEMRLSTAAIEALANGCAKLRSVKLQVYHDEAEPASIRFLIDSIVADPSWIHQTFAPTLEISIALMTEFERGWDENLAAFEALVAPAANLPASVHLTITWDH